MARQSYVRRVAAICLCILLQAPLQASAVEYSPDADYSMPTCLDAMFKQYPVPIWPGSSSRYIKYDLHPEAKADKDTIEHIIEMSEGAAGFAGYYDLVLWECGTHCMSLAIVNFKTMQVIQYYKQLKINDVFGLNEPREIRDFSNTEFFTKTNSRLLAICNGSCLANKTCANNNYYLWDGNKFQHLQ